MVLASPRQLRSMQTSREALAPRQRRSCRSRGPPGPWRVLSLVDKCPSDGSPQAIYFGRPAGLAGVSLLAGSLTTPDDWRAHAAGLQLSEASSPDGRLPVAITTRCSPTSRSPVRGSCGFAVPLRGDRRWHSGASARLGFDAADADGVLALAGADRHVDR